MIPIFDAHCDLLYQLWKSKRHDLFYKEHNRLHTSYKRLLEGHVSIQTMAIFVPPDVPQPFRFYVALEMIDICYEKLLLLTQDDEAEVVLLTTAEQLRNLHIEKMTHEKVKPKKLYVVLSLEGVSPIQGELLYLRILQRLGIRSVGITWNHRNEAADGVLEKRGSGLSQFGLSLIKELNRCHMAVDVSHLNESGFWDVLSVAKQPVMASHSNAQALCPHPRNLNDHQLEAIFKQGGVVGINFVPFFVNDQEAPTIRHLLHHVEHMLELGGNEHVTFGSDFDGTDTMIQGIEHAGHWPQLVELFQKHYAEKVVQGLFYENLRQYYLKIWEG
jgi:membrane dipeptidase